MNLRTIVAQILNEDAQIAGTQPTPQPSAASYDVLGDFQEFEKSISDATIAAKKQLETTLKEKLLRKKVKINASKGDGNQSNQDYVVNVRNISISESSKTNAKGRFSIVVDGIDDKKIPSRYTLNTIYNITILGDSPVGERGNQSMQGRTNSQQLPQDKNTGSPRSVGGISYPQTMGMSSNNPNTISR